MIQAFGSILIAGLAAIALAFITPSRLYDPLLRWLARLCVVLLAGWFI